jgi:hypothetical protein
VTKRLALVFALVIFGCGSASAQFLKAPSFQFPLTTTSCNFNGQSFNADDMGIIATVWTSSTSTPVVTSAHATWTQVFIDTTQTEKFSIYAGQFTSSTVGESANISISGASNQNNICFAYAGGAAGGIVVDGTAENYFTGTPSTIASPTITTTNANDILFGIVTNNSGPTGFYPVTPQTPEYVYLGFAASARVTTTGTYSLQETNISAATGSIALVALQFSGGTQNTNLNVSKANGYSTTESPGLSVSKAQAFGSLQVPGLSVSKAQTDATTQPPRLSVSKAQAYAVVIQTFPVAHRASGVY